ncbi:helix-turn-helix transcriptional regulator [Neobacillus sp. OS1-32]|uniref:helix-turn-helix domain-containing protein n=1 Tax=Neobacillus sp. OS1-32 TaxID=3070682 RepID=UPI0027DEC1B2|nr:helix-turn-helix transcriptional regulator [Neobacillus sp. OS1-32]WML30242.1 helix-turn-helix transcriptional regulator [Neobacillus sp. OS1-32]
MNAKVFRFIRQSKGLTQQEMADMLGVSKPLICLIERNKKNISDKVNRRLRETFGHEYIEKCRAFLEQQ